MSELGMTSKSCDHLFLVFFVAHRLLMPGEGLLGEGIFVQQ